jgi:peptidoglycan/xylan/chitin deacetylase (PgdA/CDA1 family)
MYAIYVQFVFFFSKKSDLPYCVVLAYHSVPSDKINRFKKQMRILKRFTTPIAINYDGPFDSLTRYSIVTFDDAFKSVVTNAVPEMIKLRVPFTIFIPAGCLGAHPGWLENTEYRDAHETVSSVDELSKLPNDLVTFAAHTVYHADLTQVDRDKACYEIRESKTILESRLNKEIHYFAFPYGNYNSKLLECCYKAGYKQIFSVAPEPPLTPLRKYVKGRVIVRPSDWKIEFILKIIGGYGWKAYSKRIRATFQG